MTTKKTPDQILDGAADILEKHGWITFQCYDDATGGYCALGALARAAFPSVTNRTVEDRAFVLSLAGTAYPYYSDGAPLDPNHVEAVRFFAKRLTGRRGVAHDNVIYRFNDDLPSGRREDGTFDEQVRLKSSRKVVQRLRNAAKAYRKQAEKQAA